MYVIRTNLICVLFDPTIPTSSFNNYYSACAHAQQGVKQLVCLSSVVCQHKNWQISTFKQK